MMREEKGWLPFWSLPTGSLLGIRLSISLLFPLLVPVLCLWFGLRLGALVSGILLLAATLHEFARVLAVNWCGQPPESCVLWPAGGLSPSGSARVRIVGALAGVSANLTVCLATLWPLIRTQAIWRALDPVLLSEYQLGPDAGMNAVYLLFAINWTLVLINLLLLPPFAMGVVFEALSEKIFGEPYSRVWMRFSWCLAAFLLLGGLVLDLSLVVALAAVSMLSLMTLSQSAHSYDPEPTETFLGYDFSEGYTSLDRSVSQTEPVTPSILERWRKKRQDQRLKREAALDHEVSENLDRILAQVHEHGIDSLSSHDRKLLDRASQRFRSRSSVPKTTE
jgi:hypothetical protein